MIGSSLVIRMFVRWYYLRLTDNYYDLYLPNLTESLFDICFSNNLICVTFMDWNTPRVSQCFHLL